MKPETKEWLDLAKTDFGVAEHLYEQYRPMPTEIICYHCQQASEKAIKALITQLDIAGGMPKVHDLSFLLNQIHNKVDVDERYYDYADTLTPYGVVVRYPHELQLEEIHAKKAIRYSKEILNWAMRIAENQTY